MEWALSNDSREIKRASNPSQPRGCSSFPLFTIIYYWSVVGAIIGRRESRDLEARTRVFLQRCLFQSNGWILTLRNYEPIHRLHRFFFDPSFLLDNPIEETESSIMIFTISHRSNACVQRLVIGRTFSFLPLPSANRQIPRCNLLGFCCGVALRKRARTRKSRVIFCEISHDRGSNVNRSLEDRRTDDSFKNTRGFSFFHEGGACWRVPKSRRLITQRQIHYSW